MQHTRRVPRVEECQRMRRQCARRQVKSFALDYLIGYVHLAVGDPVTAGKYLARAEHKEIAARVDSP